jgi:hypothetical protein
MIDLSRTKKEIINYLIAENEMYGLFHPFFEKTVRQNMKPQPFHQALRIQEWPFGNFCRNPIFTLK